MKNILVIPVLVIFLFITCQVSQRSTVEARVRQESKELIGFLYINISKIYHDKGKVTIISIDKDTIVQVVDKTIELGNKKYETIDEEYQYRKLITTESFDPEYGLFILRCIGFTDGIYEVEINNEIGLVDKKYFNEFIQFKNLERYVLETHPIPSEDNPVRLEPNENSKQMEGFEELTFIPEKIVGDWIKVKDNKECYKGVKPSEVDMVGWIRWRKDGVFILRVAHVC